MSDSWRILDLPNARVECLDSAGRRFITAEEYWQEFKSGLRNSSIHLLDGYNDPALAWLSRLAVDEAMELRRAKTWESYPFHQTRGYGCLQLFYEDK